MSSFTEDLVVRIEPIEWRGIGVFTLLRPFTYEIGYQGSGQAITVPVGFVSDGCSIPFFARPFIPSIGKAAKAGVLHDYMLWKGYSKSLSAKVFLEALEVLGINKFQRTLMYWSVRYWPWVSKVKQPGEK